MAKSRYTRYAGEELQKRLEELAEEPDSQRLALRDEIDLARHLCNEAVVLYDHVVMQGKLDEDGKVNEDAHARAMSMMKGALDHVADLTTKMAKLEVMRRDKISFKSIEYITEQILAAVQEEVTEKHPEVGKRLMDRILSLKLSGEEDRANVSIVIG